MYGAYILEKEKDKCTVQLILIREKLEEKYYEICEEKVRESAVLSGWLGLASFRRSYFSRGNPQGHDTLFQPVSWTWT